MVTMSMVMVVIMMPFLAFPHVSIFPAAPAAAAAASTGCTPFSPWLIFLQKSIPPVARLLASLASIPTFAIVRPGIVRVIWPFGARRCHLETDLRRMTSSG